MTIVTLLLACGGSESVGVLRVSHVGADYDGTGRAGISLDDDDGRARSWEGTSIDIDVSTRQGSGEWTPASDVTWSLDAPGADHLVVVADNSGSVLAYEETIADAVSDMGASVLAAHDDNAVGLVRVSTQSTVLSLLVDDDAVFEEAATSGLDISNGWTALYDGVRFGSDVLTLGDQIDDGVNGVCLNQSQHNILVFTDGRENNSQDQHPSSSYPGDGIDTTLSDLLALRVHGTTPAIHAIAVGDDADAATLQELADQTGGTYREIANYGALLGSLEDATVDMEQEIPVCFDVTSCDHDQAWITVTVREADGTVTVTETEIDLPQLCTEGSIPEDDDGCTYTQGYWMTHSGWPSSSMTVGSESYTAAEVQALFETPVKGDASMTLGHQLMAAKLNIANGADDTAVAVTLENADAWLSTFAGKLPYKVKAKDASDAITWAKALDDFNQGVVGPGHCE